MVQDLFALFSGLSAGLDHDLSDFILGRRFTIFEKETMSHI
jgi:hypothetical protein